MSGQLFSSPIAIDAHADYPHVFAVDTIQTRGWRILHISNINRCINNPSITLRYINFTPASDRHSFLAHARHTISSHPNFYFLKEKGDRRFLMPLVAFAGISVV